ncbi:MAG TPA: hypothetical protein V6D48_08900 [Oculatellaceae cyanobacterium]
MLALNAPVSGCCDANALKFWHLRVSKTFDKPEYYIGQTVLHKIKVRQGEILHPVTIIGLYWTGIDWCYFIQLPQDHPQFKPEDHQWDEADSHQLEPI